MARANGRNGGRDDPWDLIIIGTGAGGGTLAHALAGTGARILLVERGDFVPQEPENWDPAAVWKDLRYRAREFWRDERGTAFRPYTHYCVGGNTKFWGAVLYRLRRSDFEAVEHADGVSPAWPIQYDALEPWYERAERLYSVCGAAGMDPTEPPRGSFPHPPAPHSAEMRHAVERARDLGLHPSPLPLGLRGVGEPGGCILCDTCNSFPCRIHAKADAEASCIAPLLGRSSIRLRTRTRARRLLTDPGGRRVRGVELECDGDVEVARAPLVAVACGAVNSAALLLRSATDRHPDGLANSSGLVGRGYMAHLATMMSGLRPRRRNREGFEKTVGINDYYERGPRNAFPLGQIQSQGRVHGVMAQTAVRWIPRAVYDAWSARGADWLAVSEDLPRPENRVSLDPDGTIRIAYRPNNLAPHARLVDEAARLLRALGSRVVVSYSDHPTHPPFRFERGCLRIHARARGTRNTTHQCGTLRFGRDPRSSVLDPYCRTHDIENLFVVDSSFFPSSAAVNPGLTIAAQALRVADHIRRVDLS